MSKVVSLHQKRLENSEHLSGDAICKECGHEWVAVVPVGTLELECPQCHTWKGLMRGGTYPQHALWQCNCGCNVFTISETTNILCWRCGAIHGQQWFPDE